MKKSYTIIIIPALITGLVAAFLSWFGLSHTMEASVRDYISLVYRAERSIIENVPIYSDFMSPGREKELRRYLLPDHLRIAEALGTPVITGDNDIKDLKKKNLLVSLEPSPEDYYYFYNVPQKYRYATPRTKEGLLKLVKRYQDNLSRRGNLPGVKLAISSLIRPVEYQQNLKTLNMNASTESTHSRCVSFDIFYDDYFVILPPCTDAPPLTGAVFESIRTKLGYVLGDSLRRQLMAVLAETLLQLQEEKVLYAILEKRQRCFHVTIL